MTTRSSGRNDTPGGAIAGLFTKTSAKRPSLISEVSTGISSPLTRPIKRTRVSASASKARHKKRVGNENMMTLPVEIIIQVLSYVTPCSLVALIRTNKALRRILLNPSSKPIWQSATARVPGLPVCPTWMSEPRYAALLFSKLCTLCGASTTLKPDPSLFVRLCASCRDTGLMDYGEAGKEGHITGLVSLSNTIKPNSSRSFCLRRDVERILQEHPHLSNPNLFSEVQLDSDWMLEQRMTVWARYNDSHNLRQYLSGLEQARYEELEAIKKQRRQPIHERLFSLGWTPQDLELHDAYVKDWNALVEVARPLSDPACTTLIPRLTRFLEGSRKTKAQDTRHNRVKGLLDEYCRYTRPINGISLISLRPPWCQRDPLPDMDTLFGWDMIRDLYEADIPVDTVYGRFYKCIPKLEHEFVAWRAKTEKQLINNLKLERKPGPEVQLEAHGKINKPVELSANTRFLLHADTIFQAPAEQSLGHSSSKSGGTSSKPLFYPYLLFSPEDSKITSIIPLKPTQLSKFTRYTEAEKIAKALLADNNMPDAAYVHLRAKKAHFVCHRCHSEELLTWEEIIEHYREMNEKWENETRRRPKQMTKHKIIFTNAHELQPHAGLGKERFMRTAYSRYIYRWEYVKVECKLCLVGWASTTYDCMPVITQHLRNVHEVTGEPLENLHYGERTELFDMAQYKTEWCTRWDSYHN